MQTIRIKKSIITKIGAALAKDANPAITYQQWLAELSRDETPHDAVEAYLIKTRAIDDKYELSDYVSASDYLAMLKVAHANRKAYFVATDFETNFNDWFCNELQERLQYYGFDLGEPVNVDTMARMADAEKQKGR